MDKTGVNITNFQGTMQNNLHQMVLNAQNIAQQPSEPQKLISKERISDLAKQVDPMLKVDDDVEETLSLVIDDFLERVVMRACEVSALKKNTTLDPCDIQLILESDHNMWVPGFGVEEGRSLRKKHTTEAHKQRMNLIKKTTKKL